MTQKIQLKNIEIEYLLSGKNNSETILFVHGLGANLSQFESQQEYFSEKFQVLSVNLRGHGHTKLPYEISSLDVELKKMANDIIILLDSLGIAKIHYVGNSMGGNIGYEILTAKPEILNTLITFGTTGQLSTSKFAQKIMKFMHKLIGANTRGTLSKIAGQTKPSKTKIKEMMVQAKKSTILSMIPILANFDYLDIIKNSNTPVLILKGEKDREINRAIKTTIAEFKTRGNFELYTMNKAGHFANLDNPELFNELLEKYIANHKNITDPNSMHKH